MDKKPNMHTTAIWVLLNVAHKQVNQTFEIELRRSGLPPASWYDVLWSLEQQSDGLRQFELEKMSLFSQVNLSRNLKRMIEDGLVLQVRAKNDGRGRILTITDEGKTMRAKMWEVYGGLMISEIEERVPEQIAPAFVEGLKALVPDVSWPPEM